MKAKIILDTYSDVENFFRTISTLNCGKVELVNSTNQYRVNAKSYLGCLLAHTEWGKDGIWLESEDDLYTPLSDFIIAAANDGAYIHE